MPKKHQDTSIFVHPLSFEDTIETLAKSAVKEGSLLEASDNTTELASGSDPAKLKIPRVGSLQAVELELEFVETAW